MIVAKNVYYFDLGKTGTSYVENVIDRVSVSEFFPQKANATGDFPAAPANA